MGILTALFAGLNIFQVFSFRAYKKKFQMEAEKDEAEASESKQSALERRLTAMEALYDEQGKVLDGLRKDILRLTSEKYANERRMVQMESENKALKEEVQTYKDKVDQLEKELKAYKTILQKDHGKA